MTEFSKLVCGASSVRECFNDIPGGQLWWRIVLALHGKPTTANLDCYATTLQNGLRFYVTLYRFLAVCLALSGVSLGLCLGWNLGALALLTAAVLLLPITGLGSHAAENPKRFAVLFFAALMAYLSLLLGGATVAAGLQSGVLPVLLLVTSVSVFLFGIGSYGIELVYFTKETTQ
ncbi:MAG: hypothetical protein QM758_00095 [Armatimonas sp.]